MKYTFKRLALVSALVLAVGCSSGSDDGTTGGGGTATATETKTVVGTASAISTLTNNSVTGAEPDTGALIKAAKVKAALIRQATSTETIDETIEFDCADDGSMSVSMAGDLVTTTNAEDELTGMSLDVDIDASFDGCEDTQEVTREDDSTCIITTLIDGDLAGNITLDVTFNDSEDNTLEGTLSFSTADACEGLTVTIDGNTSTIGVDIASTVDGAGEELTMTGTICIDGTEFDVEDIDVDDFTAEDLDCTQ